MMQAPLFADIADAPAPAAVRRAERGDMWALGAHRLLVGDSTAREDVERILAAAPAPPRMLITDPPYGVDYDSHKQSGREYGAHRNIRRTGAIAGDSSADWGTALALCPAPIAYVWSAGLKAAPAAQAIEAAGYRLRQQIVWAKDLFVLGWSDYQWQHELCYYAVRAADLGEGGVGWVGGRGQSTIWQIPAVHSRGAPGYDYDGSQHPTQKPVEAFARAIRNHRAPVILDMFAGSGTVYIAAEREDRIALGIEIEPVYADMVIARYEAFTGERANRIYPAPPA